MVRKGILKLLSKKEHFQRVKVGTPPVKSKTFNKCLLNILSRLKFKEIIDIENLSPGNKTEDELKDGLINRSKIQNENSKILSDDYSHEQ